MKECYFKDLVIRYWDDGDFYVIRLTELIQPFPPFELVRNFMTSNRIVTGSRSGYKTPEEVFKAYPGLERLLEILN